MKNLPQDPVVIPCISLHIARGFFDRNLAYMVVFAVQHGLIPCWDASNGNLYVAMDYSYCAGLRTFCVIKEERNCRVNECLRASQVPCKSAKHKNLQRKHIFIREVMNRHLDLPLSVCYREYLLSSQSNGNIYIFCNSFPRYSIIYRKTLAYLRRYLELAVSSDNSQLVIVNPKYKYQASTNISLLSTQLFWNQFRYISLCFPLR